MHRNAAVKQPLAAVARMEPLRNAGRARRAHPTIQERKQFFFEKKNQKTFASLISLYLERLPLNPLDLERSASPAGCSGQT
jgi:hypothetical protein